MIGDGQRFRTERTPFDCICTDARSGSRSSLLPRPAWVAAHLGTVTFRPRLRCPWGRAARDRGQRTYPASLYRARMGSTEYRRRGREPDSRPRPMQKHTPEVLVTALANA